jgi:hypothetical protein
MGGGGAPAAVAGAAMAELGWSGKCSVGGVRWHGASAGAEEESEGGSGVVAETSNGQWGLRAVGTLRSISNLNCAWSGWI